MHRTLTIPGLLTACAATPEPVDWCRQAEQEPYQTEVFYDSGLVYEAYVRSFSDSDGDGIGDLWGVADRMDHLARLGVTDLWLMPVFPSPSRAGYDVTSLDGVRGDYGGEAALEAVFQAAHERGIRVMLDTPINHTSDEHPWFRRAERDPDDPMRDRYVFGPEQWDEYRWHQGAAGDWYYGYFGADLPDLNWLRPEVPQHIRTRLQGWLDRGLDGFRIDAVKQLIEEEGDISDTSSGFCLMAWLNRELKAHDPEARVLAEAWTKNAELSALYLGHEQHPQADQLLDVPRYRAFLRAIGHGHPTRLEELLADEQAWGIAHRMASFSGSHDMDRLATAVPEPAARRLWLAGNFLLPGRPVLYYGEEIDLPNAPDDVDQDLPSRGPMSWSSDYAAGFTTGEPWFPVDPGHTTGRNVVDQLEDPRSTLRFVLALSDLRRASPAVSSGDTWIWSALTPAVLAFSRTAGDQQVIAVMNFSTAPAGPVALTAAVPVRAVGDPGPASTEVWFETLQPHALHVFLSADLADDDAYGPIALPPAEDG